MTSLEIQPLLPVSSNADAQPPSTSGRASSQHQHQPQPSFSNQPKIDSVWKACAYGDFDSLKDFLRRDGSLVTQGDEQV